MALTAQIGTASSELGNVVLGLGANRAAAVQGVGFGALFPYSLRLPALAGVVFRSVFSFLVASTSPLPAQGVRFGSRFVADSGAIATGRRRH